MEPVKALLHEHRRIEQVLDSLERHLAYAQAAGKLDGKLVKQILHFLKYYADACHQTKEERVLLPALEATGVTGHRGPAAAMREGHEACRACMQQMEKLLKRAAAGDWIAVDHFTQHASQYIKLHREHMREEEHHVYPLLREILSRQEQKALAPAFRHTDAKIGRRRIARYERFAHQLAERFDMQRPRLISRLTFGLL